MKRLNRKYKKELDFWINKWAIKLKKEWWSCDIPLLLKINEDPKLYSYKQRKEHEAKALFLRFLKETNMKNKTFLKNKIVVDIGPGPIGLLEASNAKFKIAIEPLANEFRKHNLLPKGSDVIYLSIPAEKMPLLDKSIDIVISRNSLDHVDNPNKVVNEIIRILKPGGYFFLNVDINHPPMIAEPHHLTQKMISKMTKNLKLIMKKIYNESHGWKGQMFIALYKKMINIKIARSVFRKIKLGSNEIKCL